MCFPGPIEKKQERVLNILKELWRYRSFILGLVVRDYRSRYLNSLLGPAWFVIYPLAQILVFTLIFSRIMQARLPGVEDTLAYSIYLCAGIIHWQYFVETLTRCQNVFMEQGNLLKKVAFPRSALPLYVLISTTMNYGVLLLLFLGFLILTGRFPGASILALLPLVFLQQALALGLGVFLGALHVFFRDTGHLLHTLLQFWFWLTPIVYPAEIVPEQLQWITALNPLTAAIRGYQAIFLIAAGPAWSSLALLLLTATAAIMIACRTFRRLKDDLVDEL